MTAAESVVIIGAGPAGLTAAYMLSKQGVAATVLEADSVVGGISRTVERDGWRFDIGGHRFFTKVTPVDDLWFEILGADEFLQRPRMSRISYQGKLYDYPLVPMNALRNLGPVEAVRCISSYGWARVRPPKDQSTFEGFIAARFGWRMYEHFFKTYTEKVWGVPGSELTADFGAQRVKDLSLMRAGLDAITPKRIKARRGKSKQTTSLIEQFNYPKYGPGQMWEKAADIVSDAGTKIVFDSAVTKIEIRDGEAVAVTADLGGMSSRYECSHVISSMPMGALVKAMDPPAPADVLAAADGLTYRDFMTVALVVPQEYSFPDNWIYVHDPGVSVGRIQNFGSWSPYLVKEGRTCLGLEFFVNEGDSMWTKSDADLIEQAKRELAQLGLVEAAKVEAGYVVRMPKAYPVYDEHYVRHVDTMRRWIAESCPNVYPVGRNGMHRYNNQDHSMYTAMLSVENIFGADHDVWSVNVEEEYHEVAAPDRPRTVSATAGSSATVTGAKGTGRDAPVLAREAIEAAAAARRGDGYIVTRVLVCTPTYIEATNISELLHRVREALPDADILVLDDNSPDGTADVAEKVAAEVGFVEVLRRPDKRGLGDAYRAGFAVGIARDYDVIVQIDADLSHDPAVLPQLIDVLERGADLAIGSRYVPGGSTPYWPWRRKALSRYGNLYVGFMLRTNVNDNSAGYRAFKAKTLRAVEYQTTRAKGYGFQLELTYRVAHWGGRIDEVPITFTDRVRGNSKMSASVMMEEMILMSWWGVRDRLRASCARKHGTHPPIV